MKTRAKLIAAGAAVVAIGVAGGGAVAAASGDDTEASITGDALVRASAEALKHTGGGKVTDTEIGDEDSYYEVEVTHEDGRQVDVQLDQDFNVVGSTADREEDQGD